MKRVVVLGDVIEDIIVISDSARQLNTDNPSEISSKPGGSGANFAVWLASLGVEVELVARVGASDRARLTNYFETKFVIAKLLVDITLIVRHCCQSGYNTVFFFLFGTSDTFFQ